MNSICARWWIPKKSKAIIGFNYCEQIYKIEKEFRDEYSDNSNYYEIRYNIRNEKLAPILVIL